MIRMIRLCFVAGLLIAAPTLAEARAGGGSSSGSRGSMTYSAPAPTNTAPRGAQPVERSFTQPGTPQSGLAGQPGLSGMGARPSFMSGLMGGLIGAGIGGMLFGGGLFGGISGFGSIFGLLLQIGLVFLLVRLVIGLFANRRPAMAGGPSMFSPTPGPQSADMGGMGGGRPALAPVTIAQADFQTFERLLQGVQAAWSQHDLNALRMVTTPEMVSHFADQLAEQASRGVRNVVSDVRLEQGDLSEAWAESGREYATVAMRFSMIDVTVDARGQVVEGNPNTRVQATEIWTFVRAAGGAWVLSAVQQAR